MRSRYDDETLSAIFDKTSGQCEYCTKLLAWSNYGLRGRRGAWEVDHSVPVSHGGTDHLNNLFAACIPCNREKRARTGRSFRAVARPPTEPSAWPWVGLGLGPYALYAATKSKRSVTPASLQDLSLGRDGGWG